MKNKTDLVNSACPKSVISRRDADNAEKYLIEIQSRLKVGTLSASLRDILFIAFSDRH